MLQQQNTTPVYDIPFKKAEEMEKEGDGQNSDLDTLLSLGEQSQRARSNTYHGQGITNVTGKLFEASDSSVGTGTPDLESEFIEEPKKSKRLQKKA
jgi:hypothetical protein